MTPASFNLTSHHFSSHSLSLSPQLTRGISGGPGHAGCTSEIPVSYLHSLIVHFYTPPSPPFYPNFISHFYIFIFFTPPPPFFTYILTYSFCFCFLSIFILFLYLHTFLYSPYPYNPHLICSHHSTISSVIALNPIYLALTLTLFTHSI